MQREQAMGAGGAEEDAEGVARALGTIKDKRKIKMWRPT